MNQVSVYIGIGSNLDDPIAHVTQAIEELRLLPNTDLFCTSSLYKSAPMGPADQPDYINAVCEMLTGLAPLELLDELQAIEQAHGRIRHAERWGPRTLDLDILLFGEKIISNERLQIPHPGLDQRSFVLYPLQEITPELSIPGAGRLADLIENCDRSGLERIRIA